MDGVVAGIISALIILAMERLFDFLRDKRKRKEMLSDKKADKDEEQENQILKEIRAIDSKVIKLDSELNDVRKQVTMVRDEAEAGRVLERRIRILRFADEITHGVLHSKDHFEQLLEDGEYYRKYCETHKDFKNGITEPAINLIDSTYEERLRKNDFL